MKGDSTSTRAPNEQAPVGPRKNTEGGEGWEREGWGAVGGGADEETSVKQLPVSLRFKDGHANVAFYVK